MGDLDCAIFFKLAELLHRSLRPRNGRVKRWGGRYARMMDEFLRSFPPSLTSLRDRNGNQMSFLLRTSVWAFERTSVRVCERVSVRACTRRIYGRTHELTHGCTQERRNGDTNLLMNAHMNSCKCTRKLTHVWTHSRLHAGTHTRTCSWTHTWTHERTHESALKLWQWCTHTREAPHIVNPRNRKPLT